MHPTFTVTPVRALAVYRDFDPLPPGANNNRNLKPNPAKHPESTPAPRIGTALLRVLRKDPRGPAALALAALGQAAPWSEPPDRANGDDMVGTAQRIQPPRAADAERAA